MEKDNILFFENVSKEVKKQLIINNISLKIKHGNFSAIMGPSGAGKTSLLNIASGLDNPTSGSVFINDKEISKLKEPKLTKYRSKNIGYIFQEYNLIEYLNVKDNILFTQKINHLKVDSKKLEEIVTTLNLQDKLKSNINDLSGGQKQRVAIARALIGNNQIIFADEPTGALDINTRDITIKLLKNLTTKFNKTLILVTHDPVVASYADEIIFILNGSINLISGKMNDQAISKKMLELEKNVKNSD